jgi:hypothetical protein
MLATQEKNQTLSPQQVLTPLTTYNSLLPRPPTIAGAYRQLHYLENTR